MFLCHLLPEADSMRHGDYYRQNKDERKLIASTTKIMTALIALENSDIKKEVEVKPTEVYTNNKYKNKNNYYKK